MQVTISVSRELDKGVAQVFTATATSVAEAIEIAHKLTEMKVADLPAPSTDAAVIEKHTGAVVDYDKLHPADEAVVKQKAEVKEKPDAKAASVQPPAEQKSAPTDGAGSEKTTAEKAAESRNAPERTYEEVRQKILSISKDMGREPTVAALARFGVTAGKDLKPEQYGPAYDYFVQVINKEVDPTKSETAEDEFA